MDYQFISFLSNTLTWNCSYVCRYRVKASIILRMYHVNIVFCFTFFWNIASVVKAAKKMVEAEPSHCKTWQVLVLSHQNTHLFCWTLFCKSFKYMVLVLLFVCDVSGIASLTSLSSETMSTVCRLSGMTPESKPRLQRTLRAWGVEVLRFSVNLKFQEFCRRVSGFIFNGFLEVCHQIWIDRVKRSLSNDTVSSLCC